MDVVETLGLAVDAEGGIVATTQLGQALEQTGRSAGSAEKALASMTARIVTLVGAAVSVSRVITATAEAQRISALLTQTIATTEQAAGRTSAEVEALAATLSRLSTQSQGAVQGGLTRLLTYTTIQGETFDRAAQAAVDMAAALGGDLTQAAETVGKALGSPEFALSALSKQGFRFTEEQQRLIKALTEAGRTAEAQAIILDELESVYAGAALAARDTFGGALRALSNAFGDLFELSTDATSGVTRFLNQLATGLQVMNRSGEAMRQIGVGVTVAAGAWALYAQRAAIAAAATAVMTSASSIQAFFALARAIGVTAAAMELLGKAGPLRLVTLAVSAAGAALAFVGLKKIIGETGDEFAKLEADIARAAEQTAQGFRPAGGGGEIVGRAVTEASEDRVRAAQQELALARLVADAAALQAIEYKRVNDLLDARRELKGAELAATEQAINAEARLLRAAEAVRQRRSAVQDSQDRVRTAQQVLAAVGLEGEALATLQITQRAINAEVDARRRLSGENLAIALRGIEVEKQTLTAVAAITAQLERRKALAAFTGRVEGLERSADELRAQVAALGASQQAYDRLIVSQRILNGLRDEERQLGRALTKEEADRYAAAIRDATRMEQLLRAMLGLSAEARANPFVIVEDTGDVGELAEGLAQALSAAQGLAVAFGDVGRAIGAAVGQSAQLLTNLSRMQRAGITTDENGVTRNVGIGGAFAGQAGASGVASAAAGALGIIGATVAIADALDLFGSRAKQRAAEIAEAARQFNRALEDFAIGTTTSLEAALKQNIRDANDLIRDAAKATGVTVRALPDFATADDLLAFVKQFETLAATSRIAEAAFAPFVGELKKLAEITKRNEEALREQNRVREQQGLEDLEVRRLVAAGLDAAAEAERARLAGLREIAAAEAAFGESSPYVVALREVVALEREAAEAVRARAEAQRAEDDRRRLQTLTLDTLAFTDPRTADALRTAEEANARLWDAVQRGASEAELAAIALYNAAAQAAQAARQAEQDQRDFEGLFTRALGATGNAGQAAVFGFDAGQRQELADAVRNGMSESNLALLQFVQFAEREQFLLQRAIEEQTGVIREVADAQIAAIDDQIAVIRRASDLEQRAFRDQIDATRTAAAEQVRALDAQIRALREATKAQVDAIDAQLKAARDSAQLARTAVQVAQQQLNAVERTADALREFADGLTTGQFSPLSPEAQLAETRDRFEALVAAAQGGDAAAGANLPAAARALLEASRGFNASGPGFVSDFERVQQVVGDLALRFGTEAEDRRRLVAIADAQLRAAESTVAALQGQKEAIQAAATAQLDVLQRQRETVQETARETIQMLQDFAEAARAGAAETIEELTATRDAIEAAATEQIRLITAQLTEQTRLRIESHENYGRFLDLLADYEAEQGLRDTALEQVAQDQLTELRAAVTELRSGFASTRDDLDRVRRLQVAQAEQAAAIGRETNTALREIAQAQRLAASGPRR